MGDSRIIPSDFEAGGEGGHHSWANHLVALFTLTSFRGCPTLSGWVRDCSAPDPYVHTLLLSLPRSLHQLWAALGKLSFFPILILLHIFSMFPKQFLHVFDAILHIVLTYGRKNTWLLILLFLSFLIMPAQSIVLSLVFRCQEDGQVVHLVSD